MAKGKQIVNQTINGAGSQVVTHIEELWSPEYETAAIQFVFNESGNLEAGIVVEATCHPNPKAAGAKWTNITAELTTLTATIPASLTNFICNFSNFGYSGIRITITGTAGSGSADVCFCGNRG